MTLKQKERRKAVLRYAVSVPEWNLALKHTLRRMRKETAE